MKLSVHDKCCSCRFSFDSARHSATWRGSGGETRTGTKNTTRRLRLTLFAGFLSVRT